jgi:dTDP-4-dehydrorhamnose 3,5-epimerase
MEVEVTSLPGVLLVKPRVLSDARGFFVETWAAQRYEEVGVRTAFVQDNVSSSQRGVLRGLHIQHPFGQGKLVCALAGELFDVVVDLRVGSPTFGRWSTVTLNGETLQQVYIPPGVAHGFCSLRDGTLFSYKCTEVYHPETEFGVLWNDPDLGIAWPLEAPLVSAKDQRFPRLRDIPLERLPRFG